VVTVAELQFGVSKSESKERNQAALEAFLLPLDIAEFSVDVTALKTKGGKLVEGHE
jgi:tRNA(fMet)-specific endonuclease VapC